MLNRVFLEGEVVRSTWGKNQTNGFFVTIKQEKKVNKFSSICYFSLYANQPLAKRLAEMVKENPNCFISIEGRLKTYLSKKDNDWKTTILIEKIIEKN